MHLLFGARLIHGNHFVKIRCAARWFINAAESPYHVKIDFIVKYAKDDTFMDKAKVSGYIYFIEGWSCWEIVQWGDLMW